jgi:hypothetical protein
LFLSNLFKPLGIVGAPPYFSSSFDKRSGKTTTSWQFGSFTLPLFTDLFSKWYSKVEGKNWQILPLDIGQLMTARALAYWLSGWDAHYEKSTGRIKIATLIQPW